MITDFPDNVAFEPLPRKVRPRAPRIRSSASALLLFVLDAGLSFGTSTLLLAPRAQRLGAGLLAALLVCAISSLVGRYRRTYSVYARDEAYYTATVWAIAALPLAAILIGFARVSWHTAALMTVALGALLVCAHLCVSFAESGEPRAAEVAHVSHEARADRRSQADRFRKRTFDLAVGSVALVILAPIMAVVAIAVLIDSGAPVLFRQERVGRDGRSFRILKFRTMRVDSGSAWVKPGDTRITRIGAFLRRTSLDELPQIFNVLRGEMSLVGPRPEMLSFAEHFSKTIPHYDERHIVAPGITGWSQVYLKRNLEPADMPQVLPYDLFYVEHAGRTLDCAIILKTACEVLFHRAV